MEGKLYDEIYEYLMSHFIPGEEIPADVVVKRILAGGYVPQRYGYQNMREMFADLRKFLTVKNGADGKMTAIIEPRQMRVEQQYDELFGPSRERGTRIRRGSGEIGLLSGKSFDEEAPVRKQALPENYRERLPENLKKDPSTDAAVNVPYTEQKPLAREIGKTDHSAFRYTEQNEPDSLSDEIKQKIYAAVVMGLQLEKPLYMSTLSPVLRYAGVEHDKLGFIKSKNMIKRCSEFMDFEEVIMNGVPQTLVTVHRVPEWDEKLSVSPVQKKSGGDQLDEAEKKRIYEVLCEHMKFGEAIHMAAFSPILRTYGFDYRNYGFQKVKELAAQLTDFLSLQEVIMNGVPQTLVTLHEPNGKTLPENPQKIPVSEDETRRHLHQAAFLPPKILSVLSRMTGNPVWACEEALEESYIAARRSGTLTVECKHISRKGVLSANKELTMRFPLTLETMRGDALFGELHETGTPEGKQWFLAWVGSPEFVRDSGDATKQPAEVCRERILTPILTDCCALSDSVVRAAAFKAVHCTELETRNMIIDDYAEAYAQQKFVNCSEEYYYELKQKNPQGKTVYVLIAPNRIGEKPYYVRFVGTNIIPSDSSVKPITQPETPAETVSELRMDNAPLPKELLELAYLPAPVLSLLAHQCGMLQEQMEEKVSESYRWCKENMKISSRPDEIRFTLVCRSLKGEEITVILKPSMSGERSWFMQHFETAAMPKAQDENEPTALEQFAFLGDWDAQMRLLAQTAMPEHWDFDGSDRLENLNAYVNGVFERIMRQDKLVYNSSKEMAVFHTGLSSRYGYDIYAQFAKNLPGSKLPWRFERFVVGKLDVQFVGLPLPPSYFDNRLLPWFEPERNMYPLERQMILDKIAVLPKEFLRRYSGALEISLIERMKSEPQAEIGCYARLKECYSKNPAQLELMAEAIGRAVNYGLYRARRDYAYVVTGYLPKNDSVVWMLPVILQGSSAPDAVVAYTLEYGSYRPVALLSMEEAYIAARFIRRLEGFWLRYDVLEKEKAKE